MFSQEPPESVFSGGAVGGARRPLVGPTGGEEGDRQIVAPRGRKRNMTTYLE